MNKRSGEAFTLLELLVAMAIIAIVVGAGFLTLARSTNDRALEKAAETLHAMVRLARTQAITNGVHARLVINYDATDRDSYLRRVGVMVADEVGSSYWVAADRGAFLPEGVFVVPHSGQVDLPPDWPNSGQERRSIYRRENDKPDEMAIYAFAYPLKQPVHEMEESNPSWICIQFAPNGRLSTGLADGGGLVPASNRLIIAQGSWNGDKVEIESADNFLGIAFKANGGSYQTTEPAVVD